MTEILFVEVTANRLEFRVCELAEGIYARGERLQILAPDSGQASRLDDLEPDRIGNLSMKKPVPSRRRRRAGPPDLHAGYSWGDQATSGRRSERLTSTVR